jgi:hypothetical protein
MKKADLLQSKLCREHEGGRMNPMVREHVEAIVKRLTEGRERGTWLQDELNPPITEEMEREINANIRDKKTPQRKKTPKGEQAKP